MIYLVNAFSINMLDRKAHKIEFTPITFGAKVEFWVVQILPE